MAGGTPNPKRKKPSRPANPDEAAFLNQAVKMGLLDRTRVEKALDLQNRRQKEGKEDPIAFILLEKGYLESDQIPSVREAMKAGSKPSASSPSAAHTEYESEEDQAKREALFAKVAVKLGFLSEVEIKECRTIQARAEAKGQSDPLGFLLLDKGYITSHQIRHINEEVKKTLGKPRIAGYELESELGRGAMGVVFRARQMSLEREVALKVIPKTVHTGAEFKERFFREARTAARLNHPNIVKAIDAGETDRHYFFAMELIEGETVLAEVKRRKRLPEKQVLGYAIQIAQALQHAHKHGLVHRDIKPENLLIDAESKAVKVTDMGLAKSTEDQDSGITREGATVGTPNYISPEQVAAKKDVDIRADIYALGGSLYHMIAGAPPFTAASPILVIKKHLEEKPASLKIRNHSVSAEMNRIVMRMLEKERENRYADPTGLLGDLEQLRRMGPDKAAGKSGARATASSQRIGRKKPPFPVVPVLGIAGAVVLALIVGVVFLGGSDKKPKDDRGKTGKPDDGGSELPIGPVGDSREERAQQALEKANFFARDYPDRFDAILKMYGEVLDRFPRTAAYAASKEAIRRVGERKKNSVRKTLDAVLAEARRCASDDRFKDALEALAEFPPSMRDSEVETAIRASEDEIRNQALRACEERVARADALAAEGKLNEAVEVLKSVEGFGMPGLVDKIKPKLDKLEKRKKTSSFRELHTRVLDRIASSGLQGGRMLLEEELKKVEDYDLKDLLRADIVNIGKAEAVMASVLRNATSRGTMRPVRLKTGEVLLAEISTEGKNLKFKGPEGERTVKVSELVSPDVRYLARASRHPMACYAWYVNRDIRFILEATGAKTEGEGEIFQLVNLALNCVRFELQSALASVASGTGSAERFLHLLLRGGNLPVLDEMEDRARLLAAKSFAGAGNPFVFAQGPGPSGPGEVKIHYDFLTPVPFHQFLVPGRGLWKAGWGSLNQSARKAGQIDAFLPGEWNRFRIEMEIFLEQPVEGVGFTFHQQGDGRCYAFDIRNRGDELVSAFYFRPPGCPALAMMGTPLKIKQPDLGRFLLVSLTVRDGAFTAEIDGKQIRCAPVSYTHLTLPTILRV